jgi:hypothetical protein
MKFILNQVKSYKYQKSLLMFDKRSCLINNSAALRYKVAFQLMD